MKKTSNLFFAGLVGALALAGVACGSSGGSGKTGSGGTSGGQPPIPTGYIPLTSSPTGFVQDTTGGTGVIGPWYAYGDGVGGMAGIGNLGTDNGDSDCVAKGQFAPTACSQILSPTPGATFPPADAATSSQCTSGVAAMVMDKAGAPDYTDLWGSGISLDFNNPGGDAGPKSDLDLSKYKGIYFQFSNFAASTTDPVSNGAGAPPGAMRVNFPFTGEHGTDSPYWMGAAKTSSPLTPPTDPSQVQEVTVLWTDVGGPDYLISQGTTPPAFDVTHVQSMQFQVFTNTTAVTNYSFCVSNVALIPN
ncbi:MAG TPA: hypothetical protein VHO06_09040 [Polyangia bacterium]|nr:hypothetical protein [Polyangia bacterium]